MDSPHRRRTDKMLATTFGKQVRIMSAFAAGDTNERSAMGVVTRGRSAPSGDTTYSSLRNPVGKWSAWAARPHHVMFRGSVDVGSLIGRRAASRMEMCLEEANQWRDKFPTSRSRRSRSRTEGISTEGEIDPLSSFTRPTTAASAVFNCGNLLKHRNLFARTVDGKPVSTFGGVSRDSATRPPLADRLLPGPGQYDVGRKLVARKEVGTLRGGTMRRGNVIMLRSGLMGESLPEGGIHKAFWKTNTCGSTTQEKLDTTDLYKSLLGATSDLEPIRFMKSCTHNVQLRQQEEHRRRKELFVLDEVVPSISIPRETRVH